MTERKTPTDEECRQYHLERGNYNLVKILQAGEHMRRLEVLEATEIARLKIRGLELSPRLKEIRNIMTPVIIMDEIAKEMAPEQIEAIRSRITELELNPLSAGLNDLPHSPPTGFAKGYLDEYLSGIDNEDDV